MPAYGPRVCALILALAPLPPRAAPADDETVYVDGKKSQRLAFQGQAWGAGADWIEGSGAERKVFTFDRLGEGDFSIRMRLALPEAKGSDPKGTGVSAQFGENILCFDAAGKLVTGTGPWFGGKTNNLAEAAKLILAKRPFELAVKRTGGKLVISIDKQPLFAGDVGNGAVGKVGFLPERGSLRVYTFSIKGSLAGPDPAAETKLSELQPQIDAAINRGVAYLLSTQLRDGSWGSFQPMYYGGQTALSVYTLMKCGISPQHPAIQRGLAFLDTVTPYETYTASTMILAYEATHDPERKPRIHSIASALLSWMQTQVGRYSYPGEHRGDHFGKNPGAADLSNTQFAALGLWAATRAGFEVPTDRWVLIAEGTLECQERPGETDVPLEGGRTGSTRAYVGGFTYRAKEGTPTGSMTCAGASILKIAQVCAGAKLPRSVSKAIDNGVEAALGWLKTNYNVTANPRKGDWVKYYLYGLERACALTATDTLAGHNWYVEGSKYLVEKQGQRGDWWDAYSEPDTCFALLFLRRATAAVMTGGVGPAAADLRASSEPADAVWFRATGSSTITLWISGFGEGAAKARTEPAADGTPGGIRVKSVEWLVNNQVVQTVAGNPNKTWSGERYAASYAFSKAGNYRVSAKVTVVAPDAPAGAVEPTIVLFAKGFAMDTGPVLEPWLLEAARLRQRNVLVGKDFVVTTSSQLSAGEGHDKATDGLECTRWLCDPKDASPTIAVELKQPLKADTVILAPCCMKDESRGIFDRIREVEVRVNKDKQPIVATLPEDEFQSILVPLGKLTSVKQLEVRVTKRDRVGANSGSTGFSEVGLELRSKETK